MNTGLDPKIKFRIYELVRGFVAQYYPEELEFLDVVWNALEDRIGTRAGLGAQPELLHDLGLAAVPVPDLHCLYTFVVLSSVIARLRDEPLRPSRRTIETLFEEAFKQNQVPMGLRSKMTAYLVPYMEEAGFYDALRGKVIERRLVFIRGRPRYLSDSDLVSVMRREDPDAILDVGSRSLKMRTGEKKKMEMEEVALNLPEARFLQVLFERVPKAASRSELIDRIWQDDPDRGSNEGLNTTVARLREKKGNLLEHAIATASGIGYRWAVENCLLITDVPKLAKRQARQSQNRAT